MFSAVAPIADIAQRSQHVRFVTISEVSEPLFDHPVRPREKGGWKIESNCFRGFQADNQFKSARSLDRQVARPGTPQNCVHRSDRILHKLPIYWSVTQKVMRGREGRPISI